MAEPTKTIRWSAAWADARELVWAHRRRLLLGAGLMIVNQAMGLVLPASTKYLIDMVIGKGRIDLLWKIALVAGVATLVQAITSFSLSQVLGVAAQRAQEMRKKVQAQISRLPISYFDSTQTGKLISRIGMMRRVSGIRRTAGAACRRPRQWSRFAFVLAPLAPDCSVILVPDFGSAGLCFHRLRPCSERGEINAAVIKRLVNRRVASDVKPTRLRGASADLRAWGI